MRIAHFSDLHLRHHLPGTSAIEYRHSRRMHTILAQAVTLVNDLAPDLLLVTGDLLDYPLDAWDDPDTLAAGADDMALIQDLLRGADCPTLVLPGNHDHPALFADCWGDQALDQRVDDCRVVLFPEDAEDADHAPHRTGAAWARFKAVANDELSGYKVLAQHYLVWPERNEGYPHTYAEGKEMVRLLRASPGLNLLVSGHYHQGVEPACYRGVWYTTVPALCEAPHPVWLYQLEDGTLRYVEYHLG